MVFAFAGDSTITRFFAISIFTFSSLCYLCVLYVSVVDFFETIFNHRDTENAEAAQRTYSRLTKHLPGSALTSSRISKLSSAVVSSEIGSSLLSKSQSTCAGLSGVNNLNTDVSAADKPSGTNASRSATGISVFRSLNGGGNKDAAIG